MFYKMFLCFRKSTQRDEQFVANFKGFTAIFNSFQIVTKKICIVSTMSWLDKQMLNRIIFLEISWTCVLWLVVICVRIFPSEDTGKPGKEFIARHARSCVGATLTLLWNCVCRWHMWSTSSSDYIHRTGRVGTVPRRVPIIGTGSL